MIAIHRRARRRRELDLVPMIDVVFFLLCYFLIAGTISQRDEMDIDVPTSKTSGPYLPKNLALDISKDGTLFYDGRRITLVQLAVSIQPYLKKNPDLPITIKADAAFSAEKLTDVIRALEQMGVKSLSLATEEK
jgi:biopolymer transport protein ExbD